MKDKDSKDLEDIKEESSSKESKSKGPKIPKELEEKFKELKTKLNKFKTEVLKKFNKYIVGISLLPPQKPEKEEEAKVNKKQINILILVDDSDVKQMSKMELIDKLTSVINKVSKDIDPNIKADVMLSSELVEACYDAKYDLIKMIANSAPLYDPKDLLAALRISEVHKSMVIKKFEKYIVSYVAAGSLFRGEKSNDIDVYIIVDDTDIKKMTRYELKDKLRAIIVTMGFEAKAITGVDKQFHVQVYILTDFWESVKDANPVIFTFLRDGVPLFDRGVFMPWKLLLKMGRIKPSPEAIDMHMDIGEKLIERLKGKLLGLVSEDIFYAVLNPAQAALMLYGIPPPTPKETVQLLEDVFVKKEKLLEKKYVDILEQIRALYKDIEHGKIKEVSGSQIDSLLKKTEDYMKRMRKLFEQIQKRSEGKTISEIEEACNNVSNDVLKSEKISAGPIKGFAQLVKDGKVPQRYLEILKDVDKARKEYDAKKLSRHEAEKVRKEASIFIQSMIEYLQRKKAVELERARIRVKYEEKYADVFIFDDNVFFIMDISAKDKEVRKAKLKPDGGFEGIQKSSLMELEEHIAKKIPRKAFIEDVFIKDLKSIFGKDIKIQI